MRSPSIQRSIGPFALMLAVPAATASCIAADSELVAATEGCAELESGAPLDGSMQVDASVRAFMEATVQFREIGADMKLRVKTACANIAIDLGAEDTWSMLGDSDSAISNGEGTGACDAASSRIVAIMEAEASAGANFALSVTRGACHPDFEAQAACDARCKAEATCDSGTIETRCEPGALSVQCETACEANAYCEGTPDLPANCMGVCESTCQGECKGACIAADGTRTDNDLNCHGKCSSACNGTCKGMCKVETAIECGASVSCLGGCSGSYTEPKCTTLFTPPVCTVDQACLDGCSAEVAANAVCDPPTVELFADVSVSAEVELLVATINANMPVLIELGDAQGKLVVKAVTKVVAAGEQVVMTSGDLDGQSVACAAAAAEAAIQASAHVGLSFDASAMVTESCASRAQ